MKSVGGIGEAGRDYVQDERYIAIEHMDVRRDCVGFAQSQKESPRGRASHESFSDGAINGKAVGGIGEAGRDCFRFAQPLKNRRGGAPPTNLSAMVPESCRR